MTPEEQTALSVKYICTQFCFVPQDDGRFSVFYSYGSTRTYIREMSPAELTGFLRADFEKHQKGHNRRQAEKARQRSFQEAQEVIAANLDLDFEL